MSNQHTAKVEEIRRLTGLKIDAHRVVNTGSECHVIEANGEWIFRFPRGGVIEDETRRRWDFLSSFARVSPIPVPEPEYVTDRFIGYKEIAGTPLSPTRVERLAERDRQRIAEQLGSLLKVLHNYRDERIDFETGYLALSNDGYFEWCPLYMAKYLTTTECERLGFKLRTVAHNPMNFAEPTTILHGDLHPGNILWDSGRSVITGILDWSFMGLGVPAMDFLALADFNRARNDRFLRGILSSYGAGGDGLFDHIKQNAILEVMLGLWHYEARSDSRGVTRIIKRLKRILAENKELAVSRPTSRAKARR